MFLFLFLFFFYIFINSNGGDEGEGEEERKDSSICVTSNTILWIKEWINSKSSNGQRTSLEDTDTGQESNLLYVPPPICSSSSSSS
jgi:hypothetical protein